MTNTDSPFGALIDAMAQAAVEDYLREIASNDAGSGAEGKNPPLPPQREAA